MINKALRILRTRSRVARKIAALSVIIAYAPASHAALAYRIGIATSVETSSHTYLGYEDLMYVAQTEAWSASVSCSNTWAYFNVKDNPHFVATVLAARITDQPLKIYIDDAKTKVSGICQVIDITL